MPITKGNHSVIYDFKKLPSVHVSGQLSVCWVVYPRRSCLLQI